MNKYYHILTYGCQMNTSDSETIAGILEKKGYNHTDNMEDADLIIVLTCAVRENAELKIFGKMGELTQLKEKKPHLILGIGGCMTQQEKIAKKIYQKFPIVNIVFGTDSLHNLSNQLDEIINESSRIYDVHEVTGDIYDNLPKMHGDKHRAFVNINYGCNNFCTYCIVPHVRGRERSREISSIYKEVKTLADNGFKEVTLLGQNVNSYGNDFNDDTNFVKLLEKLIPINGLERIRFMTSHPKDMSKELIHLVRDQEKLCNHLHLPLQSGSSNILKKMNRKYDQEKYLELAKYIREQIPNATITTDIIVGFPYESEEEFEQTLKVVKEVEFDAAYTFAYSKRPGTPAAEYDNQVPEDVKMERLHRLIDLINYYMEKSNKQYLGKKVKVMVDGKSKRNDNILSGRTDTNKLIHFEKDCNVGDIIELEVYDYTPFVLWGK
ncbi:MAG: tRNA (N6-isopentenyl adenosine(37)-C2)-methylthiotransferase MiaB [Clostridia bacterium]